MRCRDRRGGVGKRQYICHAVISMTVSFRIRQLMCWMKAVQKVKLRGFKVPENIVGTEIRCGKLEQEKKRR